MSIVLISEFLFKYIVHFLVKIPIVKWITLILVFIYLFILGIQYFLLSLNTRSLEDVPLDKYSVFTRWAIKKVLPKTNKHYGMMRFGMGFVGIAFITTPVVVLVVELSKLL